MEEERIDVVKVVMLGIMYRCCVVDVIPLALSDGE